MIASINKSISICNTNIHIDSVSISRSSNRGKSYYQHRHPGIEIHYIINGQYKVTCGESTFTLYSSSLFFIPPGIYHDITPIEDNTARLSLSFMLQKDKTGNAESNAEAFYSIYNRSIPIVIELQRSEAQHILCRLVSLLEAKQEDPYKTEKILTLCASLLLELIPQITDTDPCSIGVDAEFSQDDISFKIDSFLGTNFMHNNAKSRMASELYISPRQLQRIIQKNYGMSYRQKLSETRVQIAIDLLYNTDMQIHKIAEILGYSCSANFSAFIKRATGQTPSQIRKERRTL